MPSAAWAWRRCRCRHCVVQKRGVRQRQLIRDESGSALASAGHARGRQGGTSRPPQLTLSDPTWLLLPVKGKLNRTGGEDGLRLYKPNAKPRCFAKNISENQINLLKSPRFTAGANHARLNAVQENFAALHCVLK